VRSLISIVVGLITGWLVLTKSTMIPGALKKIIGEQVARNTYLDQAINFLQLSSDSSYYTKLWIIIFLINIIPLSIYALAATSVYLWSGKGRVVFYSSLCIPLFFISYTVLKYNFYNPAGASYFSYFRGSVRYFDIAIFNMLIFSIILSSLIIIAKKYMLVRSRA
jgi:hypothetical protein